VQVDIRGLPVDGWCSVRGGGGLRPADHARFCLGPVLPLVVSALQVL
jgi:hypothetical protein